MNEVERDIATLAPLILGAGESIDILNPRFFYDLGIPLHDLALASDCRLRRRLLLVHPETDKVIEIDGETVLVKDFFREHGWEVNRECDYSHMSCLLVDSRSAFLLDPGTYSPPASEDSKTFILEGSDQVAPYQRYFDALWAGHENAGWLWDNMLFPGFPQNERALVIASNEDWDALIRHFAAHPEEMHRIGPRKFEELVAELLTREGYTTTLTPQSKDGGFDILALVTTVLGQHLYLVECKRYAPDNPVGVSLVRSLYGIVQKRQATAGVVVTTSRFTQGALRFQEELNYQMALRDYQDLRGWLAVHSETVIT